MKNQKPKAELNIDEIPFESPPSTFKRVRSLAKTIAQRRNAGAQRRDAGPSNWLVLSFIAGYFFLALIVRYFDHQFLLLAYLFCGPFTVSVYMTYRSRSSLLNPYTIFFAGVITIFSSLFLTQGGST